MGAFEQGRQVRLEFRLQEVTRHMQVTCLRQQTVSDGGGLKFGDQARMSQNRSVNAVVEDDAESRLPVSMNDHRADIHAALGHFIQHEISKHVVAAHADERDLQPQPRRSAGKNSGRRTDGKFCIAHDLLDLPELRHDVSRKDQVGVDFASDEDVKWFHIPFCSRSRFKRDLRVYGQVCIHASSPRCLRMALKLSCFACSQNFAKSPGRSVYSAAKTGLSA
ncbi:MAG: hypothetical protein PGMFKBFP_03191 [Anaerolineales bacterium]|nr:hypothetical protein [Anaerolineales bacterium]